ncbi:methyltransferase domain-containing protein [Bacillus salacetis]|uniref:methyltransferase domain-containing protein n=1 Tax=Bacillus salacetis TaxID=2315464 RepID=UPI003BA1EBAA
MNDQLLNIKTESVQKAAYASQHYNRYEPTPYPVLDRLFEFVEFEDSDRVVDFGCGTGRLNFYLHYRFQPTVIGVEMNEFYYREALENRKNYLSKFNLDGEQVQFENCLAQNYGIHPEDNVFYFFNPFSVRIFISVINNILQSFEERNRDMQLVLYYAPEDYVFFLENQTAFRMEKEIVLPGNEYEKILIYSLR